RRPPSYQRSCRVPHGHRLPGCAALRRRTGGRRRRPRHRRARLPGPVRSRDAEPAGTGAGVGPRGVRRRVPPRRPERVPRLGPGLRSSMTTEAPTPDHDVPPRAQWPQPPPETPAGEAITDIALTTFRLNARLMDAAQEMAAAGGITAAWWQVLGGVLDQPRTLADIGRVMGMSRQGVRRVADLLVQ